MWKTKNKVYNKEFYFCINWKLNLWPICKCTQNREHTTINYNLKKYRCNEHGERFILFCKQCNKNLCDLCVHNNKNHNLIYHNQILIYKNYRQNLNNLKDNIIELKTNKKEIESKMKKIINNMKYLII